MSEETQPITETPEWQKQQAVLTGVAYILADCACREINRRAPTIKGPILYPAQFTLEKLIQILQERV